MAGNQAEVQKRLREAHAGGLCYRCRRKPTRPGRVTCAECKVRDRVQKGRERSRFKDACVAAYGGACATCRSAVDLTIDHVHGRGAEHAAEHKHRNSLQFHRWLHRNNFPPGFQVLCRGCNASKGRGESMAPVSAPLRQRTLFGGEA